MRKRSKTVRLPQFAWKALKIYQKLCLILCAQTEGTLMSIENVPDQYMVYAEVFFGSDEVLSYILRWKRANEIADCTWKGKNVTKSVQQNILQETFAVEYICRYMSVCSGKEIWIRHELASFCVRLVSWKGVRQQKRGGIEVDGLFRFCVLYFGKQMWKFYSFVKVLKYCSTWYGLF